MSDKKMRLELHDFLNRDGICRHLEKMAEKGWLLEKMGVSCGPTGGFLPRS